MWYNRIIELLDCASRITVKIQACDIQYLRVR